MFDLAIDGAVARLRVSRPEARNAIPLEGWSRLAAAGEEAVAKGAHVLILSGVPGGVFCAGADIAGFDRFRDDEPARSEFRRAMREGLDRLSALQIPTIALIEGDCYGAGVAVALACDVRVAVPGARFAITPARFGISYPQEDVHRLVALVGPGQASRLFLTAASIDADEARRIGLVELLGNADDIAATIAANDPASLTTLKRAVRLAVHGIGQDDEQDRAFDDLLGSDALAERLRAHRERRR